MAAAPPPMLVDELDAKGTPDELIQDWALREAAGVIAVQLRLPGGNLLEVKSFPAAASLTEVTEAYASELYHPKIVKLNAIVPPSLAPDTGDRWETFPGEDACPGQNADELPAACEADIEACRQKCQVEGFGGFVVHKGKAYFRAKSGLELKRRCLRPAADSTSHLYLSAVEAMQELALAQLSGGIKENILELPAVLAVNSPVDLTIPEVASLERSHPEVTDLRVELGKHDDSLQPIVDKFPSLRKLEIVLGINIGKADSPASFWDPLVQLGSLEKLLISNHHDHAFKGALNSAVFESLLSWGDRGPTLKVFALTGAMNLDKALYQRFVTTNEVLSPDLEEFSVFYWYANPPQINNEIFQAITKRYRRLKVLQVGSCCHSLTDRAFTYLSDNDEGVEAGLELEKLFLVCITQVNGDKWLEPASVKRCLPKWKQFKIGAGRVFCSCGETGCGSRADVVRRLRDECGVAFNQDAPHW